MGKYKQGIFKPLNPKKYKGDPTRIVWRSSWELKVMTSFDSNPNVLEWSSEELIISYVDKTDKKRHRYFPDFVIKFRHKDGTIKTRVIEVKPANQVAPPERKNKTEKRFLLEVLTYGKNTSKWAAAEAFCAKRGWEFKILTEHDIGI